MVLFSGLVFPGYSVFHFIGYCVNLFLGYYAILFLGFAAWDGARYQKKGRP
jgi:hypothetical protein